MAMISDWDLFVEIKLVCIRQLVNKIHDGVYGTLY